MMRLPVIVSLAAALMAAAQPDVILTGSAKDCLGRRYFEIRGVTISAFDPAKNRAIVDLITSMDTAVFVGGDTTAWSRFDARYSQLLSLTRTSAALARATSDTAGKFTLTVAPIDSVLVFGYAETEDTPFYYSYRMVGGRVSTSFYLDMSGGECHYPSPAK